MCKKLVIIGAGGHASVVADIAKLCGYETILFLDDSNKTKNAVIGKVSDYRKYLSDSVFFIAIGNNIIRRQLFCELESNQAEMVTLIHPNAVISDGVKFGKGTVVMAGVVVNATAVIGEGVILNTCCSVDHDCTVGDFSHISVGAHLCGTVNVGKNVMVGAGATVINNKNVCANVAIGAGAVVVNNIEDTGTYVGVPAVKIK